jgi:hypothetical protein
MQTKNEENVQLEAKDFYKNPQNKINCGVKWKIEPSFSYQRYIETGYEPVGGLESHECYQFDDLLELFLFIGYLQNLRQNGIPLVHEIKIVTYQTGYSGMKNLLIIEPYKEYHEK